MTDTEAVRRTIDDYAQLADDVLYHMEQTPGYVEDGRALADLLAWADLWTEDGVWERVGEGKEPLRGREAIARSMLGLVPMLEEMSRNAHLNVNTRIVVTGDSARAITDCMIVRPPFRALKVGPLTPYGYGFDVTQVIRFYDELVRCPDRWRFSRRVLTPWGQTPAFAL